MTTVLRIALVIFSVIVILFLGCWQFNVERTVIIEWLTIVVATATITLQIDDFLRKLFNKETRKLLTWQYAIGGMLTVITVGVWLWASLSVTNTQMWVRLAATFLFVGTDIVWMAIVYRASIVPRSEREKLKIERYEAREQNRWKTWRAKVKASTLDDGLIILGARLRFCLVGDTLDGDLDFYKPLVVIDDKALTYDELVKSGADVESTNLVKQYLVTLMGQRS